MRNKIYRRPHDPRLEGGRKVRAMLYPDVVQLKDQHPSYSTNTRVVDSGERDAAEALTASKAESWQRIKELHLPAYKRSTFSLDYFLQNRDNCIPKDPYSNWFVLVERSGGGEKYRKVPLKSSEVEDFINEIIADKVKGDSQDWEITISENSPQEYGGNLLIDKQGQIFLEMFKGKNAQGRITTGSTEGLEESADWEKEQAGRLFVERKLGEKDVRCSWDEKEDLEDGKSLKEIVEKLLMSIPHSGEGLGAKFMWGYYEFHLIKGEDGNLEPKFVDCRQEESLVKIDPIVK